jgi:hypothetical protein
MTPFVEKMMNRSWATPNDVANVVLKTIKKSDPPLWIAGTLDASVFYYLRRIIPRRLLLPFLFACLPKARTWAKADTRKRTTTF